MNLVIIDGQGGGLGRQLVSAVKDRYPDIEIIAIGANSAATNAMLRAGATQAATGENSVIVACRRADVIIGPVGIVIADSMLGEITPAMAQAVGQPCKTDTDSGESVRQYYCRRYRPLHDEKCTECC